MTLRKGDESGISKGKKQKTTTSARLPTTTFWSQVATSFMSDDWSDSDSNEAPKVSYETYEVTTDHIPTNNDELTLIK